MQEKQIKMFHIFHSKYQTTLTSIFKLNYEYFEINYIYLFIIPINSFNLSYSKLIPFSTDVNLGSLYSFTNTNILYYE